MTGTESEWLVGARAELRSRAMPGGEARAARGQHPEATQLRRDIFHRVRRGRAQAAVAAAAAAGHPILFVPSLASSRTGVNLPTRPAVQVVQIIVPVSYTHLTLPTICSV